VQFGFDLVLRGMVLPWVCNGFSRRRDTSGGQTDKGSRVIRGILKSEEWIVR